MGRRGGRAARGAQPAGVRADARALRRGAGAAAAGLRRAAATLVPAWLGLLDEPMLAHVAATPVLASVYPLLELPIPLLFRGWRVLGQATGAVGVWLSAMFILARARPGGILILHDRWHTPRTLELILPRLAKRLRIVTLSTLRIEAKHRMSSFCNVKRLIVFAVRSR